jgi:hypothetical protein
MTEERGAISQTDDSSQMADAGGANVRIQLVGYDRPFFTALALVLAIVAMIGSFFTEWREERRVYFTMRCEGFVEQAAFDHKPVPYSICGAREK